MAKRGLGKGLGALIPTSDDSATSPEQPKTRATTQPAEHTEKPVAATVSEEWVHARYAELDTASIHPNPQQPRSVFDEDALAELAFSIKEIGLLQPVVVRPLGAESYELIAGERRLRATKDAGLSTIPAIIRITDDADMLRDALLENLHRADLNPLEEAAAYSQMLADFDCTQEQLASRIGRSRPQISNTLRLLKLPTSVQSKVASGVLSAGHARALLTLDSTEQMDVMAKRAIAEGISVRGLEELVMLDETGSPTKERKRRSRTPRSDELTDLVAELTTRVADRLDTRATVTGLARAKTRGSLVIEFADAEDLRRIVDEID
jgi:ParB family chromosome partitioning protein